MPDQVEKTERGFEFVKFVDAYGLKCSVQQSSAIGDSDEDLENPGSSFLWVGVDDTEPKIMKSQAMSHGLPLPPGEISGWMPYPIPHAVSISGRMHLNREQVGTLIGHLQRWLLTGSLEPLPGKETVNSDARIANIRKAIEAIVVPEGEDAGVILKSSESRVTPVPGVGVVYDNEYFSELGEALVALWKMTSPEPQVTSLEEVTEKPSPPAEMGSLATRLENAKLASAIDNACRVLPSDCEIVVSLENGAGTVSLFVDGIETDFASNHETMSDTIRDAIEHAQNLNG